MSEKSKCLLCQKVNQQCEEDCPYKEIYGFDNHDRFEKLSWMFSEQFPITSKQKQERLHAMTQHVESWLEHPHCGLAAKAEMEAAKLRRVIEEHSPAHANLLKVEL
ncbi:hypothetical protein Dimus_036147 [Dionaea muscipula]